MEMGEQQIDLMMKTIEAWGAKEPAGPDGWTRTVLLAMEGAEEGVAPAAIDSSKFFDVIVWEVVFSMMGTMEVPDCVCRSSEQPSCSI